MGQLKHISELWHYFRIATHYKTGSVNSHLKRKKSFQEEKRKKNLYWANYFLESFCYCCYLAPNSITYRQLLQEEGPRKRRKEQRMKLFTNLQQLTYSWGGGGGGNHSARLWGWACKVKKPATKYFGVVGWKPLRSTWLFPILLLNIGSSKSFF